MIVKVEMSLDLDPFEFEDDFRDLTFRELDYLIKHRPDVWCVDDFSKEPDGRDEAYDEVQVDLARKEQNRLIDEYLGGLL